MAVEKTETTVVQGDAPKAVPKKTTKKTSDGSKKLTAMQKVVADAKSLLWSGHVRGQKDAQATGLRPCPCRRQENQEGRCKENACSQKDFSEKDRERQEWIGLGDIAYRLLNCSTDI